VLVVNLYGVKKYRNQGLKRIKTDKQDAITICKYGIDYCYWLKNYKAIGAIYIIRPTVSELYENAHRKYTESNAFVGLCYVWNQTATGWMEWIKWKNKLADFANEYWHYDNIMKKSKKQFLASYVKWTKKNGYHNN